MVAPAGPNLIRFPVICNARPFVMEAYRAYEQGDYITAGVKLREAMRLYLYACCTHHDCLPPGKRKRSSTEMLRALRRKKAIDKGVARWCGDIIEIGNKCAHCRTVRPSLIECGCSLTLRMLDTTPEIIEEKGGRQ